MRCLIVILFLAFPGMAQDRNQRLFDSIVLAPEFAHMRVGDTHTAILYRPTQPLSRVELTHKRTINLGVDAISYQASFMVVNPNNFSIEELVFRKYPNSSNGWEVSRVARVPRYVYLKEKQLWTPDPKGFFVDTVRAVQHSDLINFGYSLEAMLRSLNQQSHSNVKTTWTPNVPEFVSVQRPILLCNEAMRTACQRALQDKNFSEDYFRVFYLESEDAAKQLMRKEWACGQVTYYFFGFTPPQLTGKAASIS